MQRRVLGHQAKLEAEFRRSLQAMRTEYRREAFDELGAESREALQEYRKLREASEEQLVNALNDYTRALQDGLRIVNRAN